KQRQQLAFVFFTRNKLLEFQIQRHIKLDSGQFVGQSQQTNVISQLLTNFAADLVGIGNDLFNWTEVLQPFDRRFWTRAGHTGNVVDLVTGQRQEVHNTRRRQTKFGDNTIRVQLFTGHGVDQCDVFIHQLGQILVTRGDQRIALLLLGLQRQRANNVVGLHTRYNQQRQAHGADNVVDRVDLRPQVVRHRRAVGLVFVV